MFSDDDAVYALGRTRESGPLALCEVHPQPRHLATIEQPSGHLLEDPRYLGRFGECRYFVCADAVEYFEGDRDGGDDRGPGLDTTLQDSDIESNWDQVLRPPRLRPAPAVKGCCYSML